MTFQGCCQLYCYTTDPFMNSMNVHVPLTLRASSACLKRCFSMIIDIHDYGAICIMLGIGTGTGYDAK